MKKRFYVSANDDETVFLVISIFGGHSIVSS